MHGYHASCPINSCKRKEEIREDRGSSRPRRLRNKGTTEPSVHRIAERDQRSLMTKDFN